MSTNLTDRLIRHQIFLERYAGTVAKALQRGIDEARNKVVIALSNFNVDIINANQLQQQIQSDLQRSARAALDEVIALNEYEGTFNAALLAREVEEEINRATDEELERALLRNNMPVGLESNGQNRNIKTAYSRFANQNAQSLVQPVRDVQITGGDPIEAAGAVTALASGLLLAQAKSLSKASVVHATNQAKDVVYKKNKAVVEEVEWISVLDSKTTRFCRRQDGKRYPVGQGPRPPAHYNCRSITRPVIKGVDDE